VPTATTCADGFSLGPLAHETFLVGHQNGRRYGITVGVGSPAVGSCMSEGADTSGRVVLRRRDDVPAHGVRIKPSKL
jgi:hypothetical protein